MRAVPLVWMVRLEARQSPRLTSAALRAQPEALGREALPFAAAPEARPLPEAALERAEPQLVASVALPSEVRPPEPSPPEQPAWSLPEDELQGEPAPPAWLRALVA
jgi:hypothetical protein